MSDFLKKPVTPAGILLLFAVFCLIGGAMRRFVGDGHVPFALDLWPFGIWLFWMLARGIWRGWQP